MVVKSQENLKKIGDNIFKDIRNLFQLKKYNEVIKDGIVRDIRKLFELEEHYHKAARVGNFYSNN